MFTEEYPVQRLTRNAIDPAGKVCITTIQRLYSILKGEEEFASRPFSLVSVFPGLMVAEAGRSRGGRRARHGRRRSGHPHQALVHLEQAFVLGLIPHSMTFSQQAPGGGG